MRKIIHIDMDCYYAAIEVRDNPALQGKPIAVGGNAERRGVIATANYEAREFGVRSAMASSQAKKLCPSLVILPTRMQVYKQVSQQIRNVFQRYTDLIEPLSLDEAYLDVTDNKDFPNATLIARRIKAEIYKETQLTASAGVSYNKSLAKIASDWLKPNGLFVVTPEQAIDFLTPLAVSKLHGVGKVMQAKLHQLGIETCGQLRDFDSAQLVKQFGSYALSLQQRASGIDKRAVTTERVRKSVSVENTFEQDLVSIEAVQAKVPALLAELESRLAKNKISKSHIHKTFIKIKFKDFSITTVEHLEPELCLDNFQQLVNQGWQRKKIPIRLLGVGVRLKQTWHGDLQLSLAFD